MNLLEATSTLIDLAKTHGREDDRVLQRAIRRMEKRLMLLKVRAAKARRRARREAFWEAYAIFKGHPCADTHQACIPCQAYQRKLYFGDFCKWGWWTGHGRVQLLECRYCGCVMEAENRKNRPSEGSVPPEDNCKAAIATQPSGQIS